MNTAPLFYRIVDEKHVLAGHAELAPGAQFVTLANRSPAPRRPMFDMASGGEVDVLVFNGVVAVTREAFHLIQAGDKSTIRSLSALCAAADNGKTIRDLATDVDVREVTLQDMRSRFTDFVGDSLEDQMTIYPLGEPPLHGSPPFSGTTVAGDCFYRFSAFRNDRRIGPGHSLRPNSYASSRSDRSTVPNALSAVGRYALPNPVPPVHVFAIRPPPGTPVLFGTVAPQFGQSGGGVEVEFLAALPPDSVLYEGTISVW